MDFARADVVDAFLQQHAYRLLKEHGVVGAAVSLVKVGRYKYSLARAYGWEDEARGLPAHAQSTLFDLGGCSRLVAAIAALLLLQEHGLPLTTDINTLLPAELQVDVSAHGRPVTLHHLLTNMSGLQRGAEGAEEVGQSGGASASGSARASASSLLRSAGHDDQQQQQQQVPPYPAQLTLQPQGSPAPAPPPRGSSSSAGLPSPPTPHAPGSRRPSLRSVSPTAAESPLDAQQQQQQGAVAAEGEEGSAGAAASGPPQQQQHGEAPLEPDPLLHWGAPEGSASSAVAHYLTMFDIRCVAPPGTAYRPCDLDWVLLGAVIEALSGQRYEAYVQQALMGPLGLALHQPGQQQQQQAPQGLGPQAGWGWGWGPDQAGGGSEGCPLLVMYAPPSPPQQQAGQQPSGGSSAGAHPPQALPQPQPQRLPLPPLTPVSGLTLTPVAICRLLTALVHDPSAPSSAAGHHGPSSTGGGPAPAAGRGEGSDVQGGVQGGGLGGSGSLVLGRALLGTLCEVAYNDPGKELAVCLGGLQVAGIGRTGRGVVAVQSWEPLTGVAARLAAAAAATAGGEGGGAAAVAGGHSGQRARGCPSLLLLAPEGGLAMCVTANTQGGAAGGDLCRKLAGVLLQAFRPLEMPGPQARAWLASLPPARPDAVVQLVVFPPAGCASPAALLEGWAAQLPDYIRVRYVQAPGRGTRREEPPKARMRPLAAAAADAIACGVPAAAPLALLGLGGYGALMAFEAARRLEGWHARPLLHLFVYGCGPPTLWAPVGAAPASGGGGGGGAPAGGGRASSGTGEHGMRYTVWRPAGHSRDVYDLPDEQLAHALLAHPRCPRHMRTHLDTIKEHLPLLRADLEVEETYCYSAPHPPVPPSLEALLGEMRSRSDEETRLSRVALSCPLMALWGEEDSTLSQGDMQGWMQMSSGLVRLLPLSGDWQLLEERRGLAAALQSVHSALARQLTVHTPWAARMKPPAAGGGGGRAHAHGATSGHRPTGPGAAARGL